MCPRPWRNGGELFLIPAASAYRYSFHRERHAVPIGATFGCPPKGGMEAGMSLRCCIPGECRWAGGGRFVTCPIDPKARFPGFLNLLFNPRARLIQALAR
jgi:hypothetical protein